MGMENGGEDGFHLVRYIKHNRLRRKQYET
jgi:hypothetical protein